MSAFGVNPPNLERIFSAFSRYGAPKSDGKELSLRSCELWMDQANLLNACVSSEDLRLLYKKSKRRTLDFETFSTLLKDMSDEFKISPKILELQLTSCGMPGLQREQPARKNWQAAAGDQSKASIPIQQEGIQESQDESQREPQQETQQELLQESQVETQEECHQETQQELLQESQEEMQQELIQDSADTQGENAEVKTENLIEGC